ncbi:NAD(P)/FAD-dependent oxidoreductase [Nocardia sp. BMG111209]|uniref:flavin-containing monooxygenase n=1 Tax=Nocardia sp. BMG111209 TaxID=1160137 RepID=UPI000371AB20|nr:NAD(P)/FAD-dependent oxidoreductase [Nocardia sp. BMG111209]
MGAHEHEEIVIIGAGIAGLGVAMALRRAGIGGFTIIERSGGLGGVWHANDYPGMVTDRPSMNYQFSFARNPDWTAIFPARDEVLAYLHHCAESYRLRSALRLRTEVTGVRRDERDDCWRLELDGGKSTVTTRYVIDARGSCGPPRIPAFADPAAFRGETVHTRDWSRDRDVTGQRVAVIGTGPAAVQLIPELAGTAARLYVFQRSPIWVLPKPTHIVPMWWRTALVRVPGMGVMLFRVVAALLALLSAGFRHRSAVVLGPIATALGRAYLWSRVRDRELRRALTPAEPMGRRRPTLSNRYHRCFTRPEVELVTTAIDRLGPAGVRTIDGRLREIDLLVLATGFEPATGEPGSGSPRPGYFTLAGPSSWGGSRHETVETEAQFIVGALTARTAGAATVTSTGTRVGR